MTTLTFQADLNATDADYWFMGQLPTGNVNMVAVTVSAHEPDVEVVRAACAKLMSSTPRFRQRLRDAPVPIGQPTWVDAPDITADEQVQLFHIGPNASIRDLFDLVDTIQSQPFEEGSPPWMCGLVTGLKGGRAGIVVKLHHALSDGTALMALFGSLFAHTAAGAIGFTVESETLSADESPWRSLVDTLRTVTVPAAVRAGSEVIRTVRDGRQRADQVAQIQRVIKAPVRSGTPSRRRSSAVFRIPLEEWKAAACGRNGGVNDLYLAVAATLGHIELGRAAGGAVRPVRVGMPVNLRGGDQQDGSNTIGVGVLDLDGSRDLLTELPAVHEEAVRARSVAAGSSRTALDWARALLPGRIRGNVAFRLSSWPDVSATNLALPIPLELGGEMIEEAYVLAPAIGSPISMSLASYQGFVHLGVNFDTGLVPDHEVLVKALEAMLADLGFPGCRVA